MVNKYIKEFRESIEKLQEDDGNSSLFQALDYNLDNDELQDHENEINNEVWNTIVEIDNCIYRLKKIPNIKVKKFVEKLNDAVTYIKNEHNKSPNYNEYVTTSELDNVGDYIYSHDRFDLQNNDYKDTILDRTKKSKDDELEQKIPPVFWK